MDKDDPKHVLSQVRVGWQCTADEIVDSRNRLHTRKTTACDNKRQQRLFHFAAIAVRFFQVSDKMIPQPHSVAQRLHCQRGLFQTRKPIVIRDGAKPEHQIVILHSVLVMIEPMGNHDFLLLGIDPQDFTGEKVDAPQHFAQRVHDRREIQVAGRDLMKHRGEQKEVIAIDEGNLDGRILSELLLQLHGNGKTSKTPAENEYALSCYVFHEWSLTSKRG